MVNSIKGMKVFEDIKNDLEIWQSNTKDCLQPNLQSPTKKPVEREQFWQNYYRFGFRYIARNYGEYNFKGILKRRVINSLKAVGLFDLIKDMRRSVSKK